MPPIIFTLGGPHLNLDSSRRRGVPPNLCGMFPLPARAFAITGVSRDSAGAAVGGCTCTLFRVSTTGSETVFTQLATTVSDGSGNYSFSVGAEGPYRIVFDLDGAPAKAGVTAKTLSG